MPTGRLHIDASFDRHRKVPLPILAAFPLTVLVAFVSVVGILSPSMYARETPNWAAQAVGQDWVDLLIAVPGLAVMGVLASRGSRRGLFLLASGMLYTFYEFVIYSLAVHFNALFLAYCGTLGIAFFALVGLMVPLLTEDVTRWYVEKPPVRAAGFLLIGVGVVFTLAWLGDIVPALVHGTTPESVTEAGAPTNPVYVMDLSIILPLHVGAGIALLRRRSLGYAMAPVILGFGVVMALSIAGMLVVMRARGIDASLVVAGSMTCVAAASAGALAHLFRGLRPS